MSDKTCADCMYFAKEPACYSSYGACLDSFAMREDRSLGMIVAVYDATKTSRRACPDFEPKEHENTCTMKRLPGLMWRCSACGVMSHVAMGSNIDDDRETMPNWCPVCGAKVVGR